MGLRLSRQNPFRVVVLNFSVCFTQGFKANPGLKLANAFGVQGHFPQPQKP